MKHFVSTTSLLIFSIFSLATVVKCVDHKPPPGPAKTAPKPPLSKHPVLIVLSYDGFRPDYFGRVPTPNFNSIASAGLQADMTNQFPTKTFPNHHSIATGLHPESHGVIDNAGVFDPKFNRVLGKRDEEFWVYSDQVVPIWILNQWAGDGRASGVSMWPGCQFPFGGNKTLPTYLQRYNSSLPFEERVDLLISWITNEQQPANLVLSYFEEPDASGHAYGPDSPQVDIQIERMDNVTGYLIRRLQELGIYEDVNLILLSDHGFSPVLPQHVINITALVPNESLYKLYGKTPIYNIAPIDSTNEEQIDNLYNLFKQASTDKNFTVYKKSELETAQPNWFYHNNRRIQPIVLVADEGYAFEDFHEDYIVYYEPAPWNHIFNPNTSVYGVHGYDNAIKSTHPFFMAHGPLFQKNNGKDNPSFVNIDLFPLFCKIGGFGCPANNGTASAIKSVLNGGESAEFLESIFGSTGAGISVVGIIIISILGLIIFLVILKQKRSRRSGSSGSAFTNPRQPHAEQSL